VHIIKPPNIVRVWSQHAYNNSIWRTTSISKTVKSPYLSNGLTDHHEIATIMHSFHVDCSGCSRPIFKFLINYKQHGRSHKFKYKLDGKYSERVKHPAKANLGVFVANTWQHFPSSHCHTYYFAGLRRFCPLLPHPSTDRNETWTWSTLFP